MKKIFEKIRDVKFDYHLGNGTYIDALTSTERGIMMQSLRDQFNAPENEFMMCVTELLKSRKVPYHIAVPDILDFKDTLAHLRNTAELFEFNKGYPDMILFYNSAKPIFVELKRTGGTVAPRQLEYYRFLRNKGYEAHITTSGPYIMNLVKEREGK